MRDLVAALEQIRTRILRVISALEAGDTERAVSELEAGREEWVAAMDDLREDV